MSNQTPDAMSDLGRLLSGPDSTANLKTLVEHLENEEAAVKREMARPSTKDEFERLQQKQKALHHGQAVLKSIQIYHSV